GHVVITNPDMLHTGILPHHTKWVKLFENLRYVVIDELHAYRGVFGSHLANVIRRLRRICRHYGSDPTFILCSATIANPRELAERMVGDQVHLVDRTGAPSAARHFVIYSPPLVDPRLGLRRSVLLEARDIAARLVRNDIQTIVFARSRLNVEVLLGYLREAAGQAVGHHRIQAYRGGYLPGERRQIERGLRDGSIRAVVSTNALELGIDIGGLDAAILVGYPGSIASMWQQAGRAGRGKQEAVAFLVAHNTPLDQYLMLHPRWLFEKSPERAVIDPDNPHIVLAHLRAAIFELPLKVAEERSFGEMAPALLDLLAEGREIVLRGDRWFWTGKGYPADDVSLRNSTDNTYTIVDTTTGQNQVIGSLDEISAFMQLHSEAVYLHQGEPYFVSSLDLEERVAYVHRADLDYYTQAITDQRIRIEEVQVEKEWQGSRLGFGDVSVTFITFMYKKIRFYERDSIGFGKVNLPPVTLETAGMWLTPPLEALHAVRRAGRSPAEGMLGLANVFGEVMGLFAMCDTHDVGTLVDSSNTGVPTLFVYDRYPGGVGFAAKAYELVEEILDACCELIHDCPCEAGCPSCVGSPILPYPQGELDGEASGAVPDKEAALVILHALLGREPYVPKLAPAYREAGALPGEEAAGSAVVRPPSEPLPERLELRLRKQLQRLAAAREERRHVR
ncbi:MAG: DEAD/DEAH box helicase, partial [Clostridia bacterium]